MTMIGEAKATGFVFYELNDVESFLADPLKIPAVFNEPDSLFSVMKDIDPYKSGPHMLFLKRLVPDSPVCRQAIKELHKQKPERLSHCID